MPVSREQLLALQDRLRDPDTFATVLLVVALDAFNEEGEDIHDWTPETLSREFQDEFHVQLPSSNLDKLMAAIAVRTTDRFWKSLPAFLHLANVLAGDGFDPTVFNPVTVKEAAWAITEGILLYPPDEDSPFSQEIVGYLGARLAYEGFYTSSPDILRFALPPGADYADRFSDSQQLQAWQQEQRRRAQEIDAIVQEGLQNLFEQLSHLPLQHGTTQNLVKALRG